MDVPQDAFRLVVAKISECARDMVKTHKNTRILPIRVNLVITRASEDESDEDGSDESIESDEAEKSCVEGSETMKVEIEKNCAICFENFNFNVGVPMPCMHVFHIKCIRDWLEKGNTCPLCRFKLPTT
ncbi:E3 ubiquitin-protein ligase RNF181 [Trifolium medium]|uniref:RING-type E3 ubiquitin transferase n=1 Tax=Trifolium medium TaxID=97028 RepID=A0A392R5L2_9FABA|nr:E3 ubiquitin-protein ligase RNF181 [Trifolium medium]